MAINITINTPYVTLEKYAQDTGDTLCAVKNDAQRGLIPTFQRVKGGKRLVNVAAMAVRAIEQSVESEPWNDPQQIATV